MEANTISRGSAQYAGPSEATLTDACRAGLADCNERLSATYEHLNCLYGRLFGHEPQTASQPASAPPNSAAGPEIIYGLSQLRERTEQLAQMASRLASRL